MGRERLQRVCRFRIVVLEEEITDFVVQRVVETSFALKSVPLT
jgi:hypothetical protein